MAKVQSLTAAEEDAIIRSRFLTQTTVSRGEPPFKKLVKKYLDFCTAAEKGSMEDMDKAMGILMREINCVELQVTKLVAAKDANVLDMKSYQDKQDQLQAQIEKAQLDIEQKKKDLEEARVFKQHTAEYEVLRQIVVEHPSRSLTQREIDRVQSQIEQISKEGAKYDALLQRRRKQFALLFHVIEELQRTQDEPEAEADAMEVDS